MKTNIFLYLSIFVALLMTSCEKTIDFNGKIPEPLIVLNSVLMPDSTINVHVSKTKFFLSNSETFTVIEDAKITIVVNETLTEELKHTFNGNYVSEYKAKQNDHIKITAEAAGMNTVMSETQIQTPVNIISIDTVWLKTDNSNYYAPVYNKEGQEIGKTVLGTIRLKIKFIDNGNQKNFYRLNATKFRIDYIPDWENPGEFIKYEQMEYWSIEYDDVVFGNSNDQNSLFDFDSGSWYGNNLFTDELINGKEYILTIKTITSRTEYYNPNDIPAENEYRNKESIIINFEHLTKDYYLYLKTVTANNNVNFFSEPVQIYNNIEGGLGNFGSYTFSTYKIDL